MRLGARGDACRSTDRAPLRCNPIAPAWRQIWRANAPTRDPARTRSASSPWRSTTKASSLSSAGPLTPSSMCRPWTCCSSTQGRLKTRMPAKRALHLFHQRRQRGFHAAVDDDRALALHPLAVQAPVVGVQHPFDHRPGHHRKARHEVHRSRPRSRGSCCTGWGSAPPPRGTCPCSADAGCRAARARRAGPARQPPRACARWIRSRACGCSTSGTPSAAAAHWRVWSSGVAPMPPQLKTTSPLAKASRSTGVIRPRSSPA